jgi:hypothetical protein
MTATALASRSKLSKLVTVRRSRKPRLRFRVELHPTDRTAIIHTDTEPPSYAGRVVGLGTGRPRCLLEAEFTEEIPGQCRRVLRQAAVELNRAGLTPSTPAVELPEAQARSKDASCLNIQDVKLAFTVDLEHHAVSVHTGVGPPKYVGQVIHIGDGLKTQFRLHPAWVGSFGEQDCRDDIRDAGVFQWHAKRNALASERQS